MLNRLKRGEDGQLHGPVNKKVWASFAGRKAAALWARAEATKRGFGPDTPQTVQRVYALFPCPWPKERHVKHRLFAQTFLTLLNSRLVPEGTVQMVTDHEPYLHWVLAQVPDTGFEAQWTTIAPRFSTKYERKWCETGQQEFYDLRLWKTTHIARPFTEDATLHIHRIAHFDATRFQPGALHGAITVTCKEFLYDPRRQKGMVWVFVAESGLTQDFWIEIVRNGRCGTQIRGQLDIFYRRVR